MHTHRKYIKSTHASFSFPLHLYDCCFLLTGMSDDLRGCVRQWREPGGVCYSDGGSPAGKPLYTVSVSHMHVIHTCLGI